MQKYLLYRKGLHRWQEALPRFPSGYWVTQFRRLENGIRLVSSPIRGSGH